MNLLYKQKFRAFPVKNHPITLFGKCSKDHVKETPADAPTIKLSAAFWRKARIVETRPLRKSSVHLRLDPDTLEFYRSTERGHLTRMAQILKAYAETESRH